MCYIHPQPANGKYLFASGTTPCNQKLFVTANVVVIGNIAKVVANDQNRGMSPFSKNLYGDQSDVK